jgi:hypothetical protein
LADSKVRESIRSTNEGRESIFNSEIKTKGQQATLEGDEESRGPIKARLDTLETTHGVMSSRCEVTIIKGTQLHPTVAKMVDRGRQGDRIFLLLEL